GLMNHPYRGPTARAGTSASSPGPRHPFRTVFFASIACAVVAACGWDPSRPFDRDSPQVNEALREYDAGEAGSAAGLLEDYLTTGDCSEGNIGTPPQV